MNNPVNVLEHLNMPITSRNKKIIILQNFILWKYGQDNCLIHKTVEAQMCYYVLLFCLCSKFTGCMNKTITICVKRLTKARGSKLQNWMGNDSSSDQNLMSKQMRQTRKDVCRLASFEEAQLEETDTGQETSRHSQRCKMRRRSRCDRRGDQTSTCLVNQGPNYLILEGYLLDPSLWIEFSLTILSKTQQREWQSITYAVHLLTMLQVRQKALCH